MELVVSCITFSISFLALFAIGEFLFHILKVKSEYTRKFTHIGGAIITLFFPIYLHTHWAVLILSALFGIILFVTGKLNLLQSVHSVKRITFGSFLFPVAIYISFISFEYTHNYSYYYLPVLILALCDPAAALVGQAFPLYPIKIGSETKTLSGFAAFFILAFILSTLWFVLVLNYSFWSQILLILCISIFSSIVEFISKKGVDNVTIPSVILLILFLFELWKL